MAKASATKKVVSKNPVGKKIVMQKSEITNAQVGIDWRSLYLYAVSLITLMVCLFSLVSAVRNGILIGYPESGYIDQSATAAAKLSQIDSNRRNSIMNLINDLTTLVIAGPIYRYHWRKTQKS